MFLIVQQSSLHDSIEHPPAIPSNVVRKKTATIERHDSKPLAIIIRVKPEEDTLLPNIIQRNY